MGKKKTLTIAGIPLSYAILGSSSMQVNMSMVDVCAGGMVFQSNSVLVELHLQTYISMCIAVTNLTKYCPLREV